MKVYYMAVGNPKRTTCDYTCTLTAKSDSEAIEKAEKMCRRTHHSWKNDVLNVCIRYTRPIAEDEI